MSPDILIIERLTRVEEKIDALLFRLLDQTTMMADHEGRIRSIEKARWYLAGGGVIVAGVLSAIGVNILDLI
jgi:hypothetical protein